MPLMSSGSSNDIRHLLHLSLGSLLGTESLLSELLGSLVTGVSKKIDDSSLVWGKTSNLLDQVLDEDGSLRWLVRRSLGDLLGFNLVSLVLSDNNTC